LDQFEELFTTHPGRYEERTDFFSQLQNCLLAYPQLSILLSMREDYIAHLDSYAAQLPDRLRTRYRLELLEQAAALEAVKNPAHQVGVDFSEAAAHKLVDDLRRMRVQRLDGTTGEQLGPHVEPVQLQVVCRRLWDKLPPDTMQIVEPDVEAVGDVDIALSGYYAERVGSIADQAGISERAIRDWFDRHLITEQGIRGQVLQGAEQSEGLDNRAIWPLVDAHLVRAEKRRGATWFELAHDRLIEPVRADNAAWRESHLSVFQRQAALWESQDQPPSLLLSDQALVEAEEWITTHGDELTDAERDFLEECRQAVEHAALEEQVRYTARLRKLRRWALGETIGFGLAIVFIFLGSVNRNFYCGFLLFAILGVVCALAVLTSTISLSTAEMLERRRAKR
jgi:hypothetical protein